MDHWVPHDGNKYNNKIERIQKMMHSWWKSWSGVWRNRDQTSHGSYTLDGFRTVGVCKATRVDLGGTKDVWQQLIVHCE